MFYWVIFHLFSCEEYWSMVFSELCFQCNASSLTGRFALSFSPWRSLYGIDIISSYIFLWEINTSFMRFRPGVPWVLRAPLHLSVFSPCSFLPVSLASRAVFSSYNDPSLLPLLLQGSCYCLVLPANLYTWLPQQTGGGGGRVQNERYEMKPGSLWGVEYWQLVLQDPRNLVIQPFSASLSSKDNATPYKVSSFSWHIISF